MYFFTLFFMFYIGSKGMLVTGKESKQCQENLVANLFILNKIKNACYSDNFRVFLMLSGENNRMTL